MLHRHRRIAWLLNHRTLMPYEAGLISRLGFEVFTPKVIPTSGFRSGAVTYRFDDTLTIPRRQLQLLNSHNFYEDPWSPQVVRALNRYFGTIFVMPHGVAIGEAVSQFEGQILLRAFGHAEDMTYARAIEWLHGYGTLRTIEAMGTRFWFAEGYDNLHDIEPPVLAERAMYLPIGAPDSLDRPATWRSTDRRVLVACPSIAVNSYYGRLYREFKAGFSDLPHVIVGVQEQPVEDPNVLGFVSADELESMYTSCAALYYPSREPRHIHYIPIEAAASGMPVIFYRGSLIDRMSGGSAAGGVATPAEAHSLLTRLVNGDAELAGSIVRDQQELLRHFTDHYCLGIWQRQFAEHGFTTRARRSKVTTIWTETRRSLLMPLAHGRSTLKPAAEAPPASPASISLEDYRAVAGTSLADGLEFASETWPAFVQFVDGVGLAEPGGRWVREPTVTIALHHTLSGRFRLAVLGFPSTADTETPIEIAVGGQSATTTLTGERRGEMVGFDLHEPVNTIEIRDLSPERRRHAQRFGLVRVSYVPPPVPFPHDDGRAGTVLGTLDLSQRELPPFVLAVRGLSGWEGWGRWSDRGTVTITLAHTVQGCITVAIRAVAIGRNIGEPITVAVGAARGQVVLGGTSPGPEVTVALDIAEPTDTVQLEVPFPACTDTDQRLLGIAVSELRLVRR